MRVSQVPRIERLRAKSQPCATTTFTPRIDGPDSPTILCRGSCELAVPDLAGSWNLAALFGVEIMPRPSKSVLAQTYLGAGGGVRYPER
jgi:hypothetical protein